MASKTTKDNTRADKLELVRSKIRPYADFPKAGITFHDVFGVMSDPTGLRALMDLVQEEATLLKDEIDAVVGLDSRGFLFGPHMALAAGVGFVPIRKKGKLPGQLATYSYETEYSVDTMEIKADALVDGKKRVLVVDDLLATGGTLAGACCLIEDRLGGHVVSCFVVIELLDLKGRKKVKSPVKSLIQL